MSPKPQCPTSPWTWVSHVPNTTQTTVSMSPGVRNTVLSPPNFAANLPPTLAKSQVSSVRKNLKLHLLSVLRHPSSGDFQPQITTLLVDLGTQQAEIARSMPSPRDARKRTRDEPDTTLKKMKIGESWAVGFVPSFVALPSLGGPSTTLWGIKCPSGSSQCPSGSFQSFLGSPQSSPGDTGGEWWHSTPSGSSQTPKVLPGFSQSLLGTDRGTRYPWSPPSATQGSPSALLGAP